MEALEKPQVMAQKDPVEADVLPLLPASIRAGVREWLRLYPSEAGYLSEIRIRAGFPLCLVFLGRDELLDGATRTPGSPGAAGRGPGGPAQAVIATRDHLEKTLALVSDCSYYALENEFANGYITIPGGHRVGLAGQVAVWPDGSIRIREVSGLNIRIAREVRGAGDRLAGRLANGTGRLHSTLIISPPGCGKTTLLRDLCRISSEGLPSAGINPSQVGIVDERSEIAACYLGVPQHDVGPRADVLDRCPKAKGIMMLLRSMGPGVVATDEIGSDEDARAVATALSAGASVLATCHGESIEQVKRRPHSSWLVSSGYFERIVILSRRNGPGTVEYAGEPK